jgi:threonylcarbamoyladenosine tRNA methylthiotransferase MtaB
VQDGCDNRCSFCVIPFVRGQSRSLTAERILGEVEALVQAGFRELVISGINLGRWGRDLEFTEAQARVRFEDLIRRILEETSLAKLRISSVEPMDWSDDLITLVASSTRIAKHAHVPMQSGSDAVLRRMHRKYRPWHYREKIEKLRSAMPYAAIGADVMVGFPGETHQEFEETRRMVEDLPFTYLHVFTYSARPGTPAAKMTNQVPVQIARERNRVLRELAAQKKNAFLQQHVGREVDAITLHQEPTSTGTRALTENYLDLIVPDRVAANRWVRSKVERVENGELLGNLIESIVPGDLPAVV